MDQDYMEFDPRDQELEDSLRGLQNSLDADMDAGVDVGLEYDENDADYVPEKPAPKPKKKKSARKRYGQMALGAMIVAAVLLILLLVFMRLNRVRTGREDALAEAYARYTAGDEAAVDEIRTLSEKYDPAKIVVALIEQNQEAASAAAAQPESFGNEVPAAPSAQPNNGPAVEDSALEDDDDEDLDDEDDDDENEAAPLSDEAKDAVKLWKNGDYSEAMEAFNKLAKEDQLSFDLAGGKSNSEVFQYGAVCGMLDMYEKVSPYINYEDVVLYDCKDLQVSEYDTTKPVYLFEAATGDYLCAYSKAEKKYVYWTKDDDKVDQVKSGKKHDLLSVSTVLSIRKQVQ